MTSPYAVPLSDLDAERVSRERQVAGQATPGPDPTLAFGVHPEATGAGGGGGAPDADGE